MKALDIDNFSVAYQTECGEVAAVRSVRLGIAPRQTMGLVGESGSGKTTLALGAINYLPPNGRVTSGTARLHGTELLALSRRDMREVWGSRIGLVSQDPRAAFNPSLTIARQMDEMGRRHLGVGRRAARDLTLTMLARVDMPDPRSVVDRYPHQLSGGMLQRASLAMALLTSPELLILDEPTTALDVTTQAMVLDLLDELKTEFSSAILYITHNLGVVARVCDRVAVMYAGEILEEGEVAALFGRPLHPYTLNLLNCVPSVETERGAGRLATISGALPSLEDLPAGCVFAPRCPLALESCRATRPALAARTDRHETACLRWESLLSPEGRRAALQQPVALSLAPGPAPTPVTSTLAAPIHFVATTQIAKVFPSRGSRSGTRAVDGVTLWMDPRRTLGLVGESGSGKTTLARVVAGLSAPTTGGVSMEGRSLGATTRERDRSVLRRIQMVFQHPEASLNPRHTVGQAIARPLVVLGGLDRRTAHRRAYELLDAVRLPSSYFHRYPAELSGGEKQRAAIARAFAASPDLVICDEPISSLDVSVQGSLMNLLVDLQEEQGTSYLFISHDLAAVQHLSHRIAVMYLGRLMEQGEAALVLAAPYHPYTEALLSAVPLPDPSMRQARVRLRSGASASDEIPSGCRFHPRCPRCLGDICREQEPPWQTAASDHAIYCHIPLHELARLQRA
jgi:peptide/nickel transport system ATP-binding protein